MNITNMIYFGHTLNFQSDGSGVSLFTSTGQTEDMFQWEILNSNSLKLTFDNLTLEDTSSYITIEDVDASNSQLILFLKSDLYEGTSNSEIFHKGNFNYE